MIKNLFDHRAGTLAYVGEGWSLCTKGDLGWASLKAGNSEFLYSDKDHGAFLFDDQNAAHSIFPDLDNVAHDQTLGRVGSAGDGVHLIRFTAGRNHTACELYFGANSPADQQVRMFLNAGVVKIATGNGDARQPGKIVTMESKMPVKCSRAVLEHADGRKIVISSITSPGKDSEGNALPPPEFEVGVAKNPSGEDGMVVTFPCRKFAANPFQLTFDSKPVEEILVKSPTLKVVSSDDPGTPGSSLNGATVGAVNPNYTPDTKLDFGMQFGWAGPENFKGYAEIEIIHALGKPHYYERQELGKVPSVDGKVKVTFHPKFTMPGVSEVWVRLVDGKGSLVWMDRYRMGYDLEHYKPEIRVEPDFKQFWDTTLEELRSTPLEAVTERVKKYEDEPKFEIYDVTFNGWNKQRLHAMLFVPKGLSRPMAAMVTSHPATTGFGVNKGADGVYGSEVRQSPDMVTIVPLIRGYAPDAKDIPFNNPWWGPMDDRDTYVARAWYCAMVRAVDYLATRPDLVDMKRVVAKGGSQGGALALVTSALDPRIAVCLADCPAVCQQFEIMEHYGSFGPSKGVVPPGKTVADVEKLLSYYNPVNFCPYIKCPTYVGSNIGDLTVHSMGPLAAYHNLTGLKQEDKAFYPGFTVMHGSGPGLYAKQTEWMKKLSGGQTSP